MFTEESTCQEGVFAQNEVSESSGVVRFSCKPQRTTFSLEVVLISQGENARRVRVFQGKGMYECMCVCMNVCMYICMNVCMYVYMYSMYVCM